MSMANAAVLGSPLSSRFLWATEVRNSLGSTASARIKLSSTLTSGPNQCKQQAPQGLVLVSTLDLAS